MSKVHIVKVDTRNVLDETSNLHGLRTETWLIIDCDADRVWVRQRTQRDREAPQTMEQYKRIEDGRLIQVQLDGYLNGRQFNGRRLNGRRIEQYLRSDEGQWLLRKICDFDDEDNDTIHALIGEIVREEKKLN